MKPKIRKLLTQPRAFVRDMVRNRVRAAKPYVSRLRPVTSTRRYSVVAAVYGVEAYLDDFFRSIVAQTLDFEKHIEVVVVDDGSPDRSADIIARWQKKYPASIRYVRKENGGQASARNVGLQHVTGDWVTFIDSDDFVDPTYFEQVDRFLSREDAGDVAILSTNTIFFREKGRRFSDTHPLKFRFARGDAAISVSDLTHHIILSAASSFFRATDLARLGLRFDERIKPNFEDGHFIARFLLASGDVRVGFVAGARYYYRKRAAESSTLDGAWTHPGRYSDVIEHGYLDLLRHSAQLMGHVPLWIQRTILYDLVWLIKVLVNHDERVAFLPPAARDRLPFLLRQCFHHIDEKTVVDFELAGCWVYHKVGILNLFKDSELDFQRIYLQSWDAAKRMVELRYYKREGQAVEGLTINGADIAPNFAKTRRHDLLGEAFVSERILWVHVPTSLDQLRVEIDQKATALVLRGRVRHDGVTGQMLESALDPSSRAAARPWFLDLERRLAVAGVAGIAPNRYENAYLFMDRDVQADDNAEHLYRYVLRHRPDINAFFVLRKSSHDWDRLAHEGFRLIPFGTIEHRVALVNARHVISSHADNYVLGYPTGEHRRTIQRSRFTFLQHGVIKDDLSSWLNDKHIDCFVTASTAEHDSIIASGGPYKFTEHEMVLTGLPRHDALGAGAPRPERTILVMPTWRQSLVGSTLSKSAIRQINPAFYASDFANAWKRFLHSPRLRELMADHDYRVIFFPHANLTPYLEWFAAPDHIEMVSHAHGSIQQAFRRAAVMITDYSSAAFDMAYLRRAVIYYQFDREMTFSGGHTTRRGYFDYDRDGFGPACRTEEDLFTALDAVLERGGAAPEHVDRMERVFAYRDGQACRRTLDAILALDEPQHPRDQQRRLRRDAARMASEAGAWQRAQALWETVRQEDGDVEADRRVIEAKLCLGKVDEAAELLDSLASVYTDRSVFAALRAEIASSLGEWALAAERWSECIARATAEAERRHAALKLAEAKRMQGDLVGAHAALEASVGNDNIAGRIERAEIAAAGQRWGDAAEIWSILVGLREAPEDSLLRLAELEWRDGKREAARAHVEQYLGNPAPRRERDARALRLRLRDGRW